MVDLGDIPNFDSGWRETRSMDPRVDETGPMGLFMWLGGTRRLGWF